MRRRALIAALVGAVVATVLAGGVAWAAIPDAAGVINGCYAKRDGQLRLVDSAADCSSRELAIGWNQQGPKGDKGDPGLNGTNGTDGQDGADGVSVTSMTEEPGPNCTDGGSKFTAANGVTYACNGAQGPAGPPGPGSAVLIANVNGTGTMVPGGDATASTKTSTGRYTLTFPSTVTNCAATVSAGTTPGGTTGSSADALGLVHLGVLGDDQKLEVIFLRSNTLLPVDTAFHLIVAC